MSYQPSNPIKQFPSSDDTVNPELQSSRQWMPSTATDPWNPTQSYLPLSSNFWPSSNFINPIMELGWDYFQTISGAADFEPESGLSSIPGNVMSGLLEESEPLDAMNDLAGKTTSSTDVCLLLIRARFIFPRKHELHKRCIVSNRI
jgi:hypothetical protein